MSLLFLGLIFSTFNFTLNIGQHIIGLIPDFVGYILILKGLDELSEKSSFFVKARLFAVIMSVFCGIVYFLDLIGTSSYLGYMSFVLSILTYLVYAYLTYLIISGILEIEKTKPVVLNGKQLYNMWLIHIILAGIATIPYIYTVLLIPTVIMKLVFLFYFYKTKSLYLNHTKI